MKTNEFVTRMLFLVFGAVVASAGFVVAAVLVRDHNKYGFVQIWLAIAAIVIIFTVGAIWFLVALKGDMRQHIKEEVKS